MAQIGTVSLNAQLKVATTILPASDPKEWAEYELGYRFLREDGSRVRTQGDDQKA